MPLLTHDARLPTPARLGVLADTHFVASRAPAVMEQVGDFFRRAGVDGVLHAGDAGTPAVLEALKSVGPVFAVRGNADPPELLDALPDRVHLTIGARRVLLLHGHQGKTALVTAKAAASPDIDLIVFGHSHKPLIELIGQTILFNPGSPTERRWNPHFGVGLIAVSDDVVEPELVLFDRAEQLAQIEP